jgi:hypothetical protein
MIIRDTFYSKYREHFGNLKQSQVTGLNFLLKKLDKSRKFNLASEYAYILATIKHECAEKYAPITEYGSKTYLKSKRYYPYIGRGYVQLTWDFNYEKFGKLLKIDLPGNPDLALEPETSWKILEIGMSKGLYTGKKLGDYVNEDKTDYRNARRVINGLDRADLIAGYAKAFYDCIEFN